MSGMGIELDPIVTPPSDPPRSAVICTLGMHRSGTSVVSRIVNLLGVHRWPLMTALDLTQYRDWLEQRARLADAGTYMWTWIQTHVPEHYPQLL